MVGLEFAASDAELRGRDLRGAVSRTKGVVEGPWSGNWWQPFLPTHDPRPAS